MSASFDTLYRRVPFTIKRWKCPSGARPYIVFDTTIYDLIRQKKNYRQLRTEDLSQAADLIADFGSVLSNFAGELDITPVQRKQAEKRRKEAEELARMPARYFC